MYPSEANHPNERVPKIYALKCIMAFLPLAVATASLTTPHGLMILHLDSCVHLGGVQIFQEGTYAAG